ncbi:hypothetical protein [Serinibacter arcticus]|uniref:hypothetical protein n=1 Tax=Serinibacter arcticus TaxID=1655435 RepID=UPI0013049523|nr:hypothetical protein [Serinibacter arcticus]
MVPAHEPDPRTSRRPEEPPAMIISEQDWRTWPDDPDWKDELLSSGRIKII